jgi:selenocysteine lyase/cysteine desulfurase
MPISRRSLLQGIGGLSIAVGARSSEMPSVAGGNLTPARTTLPDKANFDFEGTHLNAAYTHPLGRRVRASVDDYFRARMTDGSRNWPVQNSRDDAVAAYARLINASPSEIAVVPSTLEGENLIGAALGLGERNGVVTDPLHYDASLVIYGEMHKRGMPLTVIAPRENRIHDDDLEAALSADTRLVAVSLVSSATGYTRDLKRVCEIAHAKGALVYADVIQAAGAIPIDVKASGVRLPRLKRVQVGWRQIKSLTKHFLPFDPPGPAGGDWEMGTDTASVFEVSTPDWSGLATALGSINYIQSIGVEAIARHRAPLLARLREELPRHGFQPLTPADAQGSYIVFSYEGAYQRFHERLQKEKVFVTVTKNLVRISPSVYNDDEDIGRLLRILCA